MHVAIHKAMGGDKMLKLHDLLAELERRIAPLDIRRADSQAVDAGLEAAGAGQAARTAAQRALRLTTVGGDLGLRPGPLHGATGQAACAATGPWREGMALGVEDVQVAGRRHRAAASRRA